MNLDFQAKNFNFNFYCKICKGEKLKFQYSYLKLKYWDRVSLYCNIRLNNAGAFDLMQTYLSTIFTLFWPLIGFFLKLTFLIINVSSGDAVFYLIQRCLQQLRAPQWHWLKLIWSLSSSPLQRLSSRLLLSLPSSS